MKPKAGRGRLSLEATLKMVAFDGLRDLSRLGARIKVVPVEAGNTVAGAGAEGIAGLDFLVGFFLMGVFLALLVFLGG
jgi:hypothetical protein